MLAVQQQETTSMLSDTKLTLSARLQDALNTTQANLRAFGEWMWSTGQDWPDPQNVPVSLDFDDGEQYLPSKFFGKGKWLTPQNNWNEVGNKVTLQLVWPCSS